MWILAGVLFFFLGVGGVLLWSNRDKLVIPLLEKKGRVNQEVVVSWDPTSAVLTYTDKSGGNQQITIRPLRPGVVVPVYENGVFVKEEVALSPQARYWKNAFCPGDALSFEMNETGEIKTIRNKGLRQCEE